MSSKSSSRRPDRPPRCGDASTSARRLAARACAFLAVGAIAFVAREATERWTPSRSGPATIYHEAAAEPPASSNPERVRYWLDRIVQGPETTVVLLPAFHQNLLLDAQRNLASMPAETLDRLADPAFRASVQTRDDVNPWLGILGVLVRIGSQRAEVSRAWAQPALAHRELILRRSGLGVFVALRDPADGPLLVGAFRRDPEDRLISGASVRALLSLGPPWDAAAGRVVVESGVADSVAGSSATWEAFETAAEETGADRDDLLAWWDLFASSSAPRARPRRHRLVGASVATDVLPYEQGLTGQRLAAAHAQARLAKRGHTPAVHELRDLGPSASDELRAFASGALALSEGTGVARAMEPLTEAANGLAARFAGTPPVPTVEEVADLVRALRERPASDDPAAATDLRTILFATPVTGGWKSDLSETFRALRARGVEPIDYVDQRLRSGDPSAIELALVLAQDAKDPAYIDVLEAWYADRGSERFRLRARRTIGYLYSVAASSRRIEPDRLAKFARLVATWVADASDRSGKGFASLLLDLGAPAEPVFVEGLSGPLREAYVSALTQPRETYASPAVLRALLDGVTDETPAPARASVWDAVFHAAPAESAPILGATVARLRPPAKDEAQTMLRVVRERVPARP